MRPLSPVVFALPLVLVAAVSACRSDEDPGTPSKQVGTAGQGGTDDGQGGEEGEAGKPSKGGSSGTSGKGGSAGKGGTGGKGGAAGTAGKGGASGASGKGGAGGAGGKGGASGKGGGGGAPIVTPTGGAELTPGEAGLILLKGVVVTPDQAFVGQVLVKGAKLACVRAGEECAGLPEAAGATIIDTKGIIAPGMIDTHNHILFDIFNDDDWLPSKSYQNATQWSDAKNEPRYGAMVDTKQCLENSSSKPADKKDANGVPIMVTPGGWCDDTKYGNSTNQVKCEMDKWGELKGLISGTTSIVGLPGTAASCFASVARSIDTPHNRINQDLGLAGTQDFVQTSALFPPSNDAAQGTCDNVDSGKTKAYLIHTGEGIDEKAADQFVKLGSIATSEVGCLLDPATTITHGTAFNRFTGRTEFETMAEKGMKLTWSPKSNFALYGDVTQIPKAREAGVLVALAPDWSLGGSQNMLDEVAFAAAWDNDHFGDTLTSQDIVTMATKNAAAVVALSDTIGELKEGYLADLFVVGGTDAAPFDDIVASKPRDVRLVMVGGRALYGDAHLVSVGPAAPGCDMVDICGVPKFLCVAETETKDKLGQSLADIQSVLDTALSEADAARRGRNPDQAYDFAPLAPLVICQ